MLRTTWLRLAMFSYQAIVLGRLTTVVENRGGDVVSLRWSDEVAGPSALTLAAERFEQQIEAGVIVIVDPAGVCNRWRRIHGATAVAPGTSAHALP